MKHRLLCLAALALASIVCAAPAQAPQPRKSPHETIGEPHEATTAPHETASANTGRNNRIMIVYGRPYTADPDTHEPRKIWGGVIPYGKIWRLGADEATLFITQKPLDVGGASLPAGAYTLYLLPAKDGSAQLIINREIGQWGLTYHQDRDLARVPMEKQSLPSPVNQFTISIENGSPKGGLLKFSWEQTQYVVPFAVKG